MNFVFKNTSIVSVNSDTIILNVSGKTKTFKNAKLVSVVDGAVILDLPLITITAGDYLTIQVNYIGDTKYRTFIAKEMQSRLITYYITQYADGIKNSGSWGTYTTPIRYATPEEIQELNEQLAAEGKCWNTDTMQIEKLRWKPDIKDIYYYITSMGSIKKYHWENDDTDRQLFSYSNCFKTKEEAEAKLKQIKEILSSM